MSTRPLTIGVPVFNGERYITETLEALLGQTFGDFRLIISDNASTDGTEELCRKYESADSRIVYRRNSVNLGAARNYNLLVEMADTEYFKWQCADDGLAPTFVERCMEVLQNDRSAVIAYSKCLIIDAEGRPIANALENSERPLPTHSTRPDVRFRAVAHESHLKYRALEQFGVIRTGALKTTPLVGAYAGADHVLLARLALLGRFHEVPEYLFLYREHPWQSTKTLPDYVETSPARLARLVGVGQLPPAEWFDPQRKGKVLFPEWKLQGQYLGAARSSPLGPTEKFRSYKAALGRVLVNKNWARLGRDLILATDMALAAMMRGVAGRRSS